MLKSVGRKTHLKDIPENPSEFIYDLLTKKWKHTNESTGEYNSHREYTMGNIDGDVPFFNNINKRFTLPYSQNLIGGHKYDEQEMSKIQDSLFRLKNIFDLFIGNEKGLKSMRTHKTTASNRKRTQLISRFFPHEYAANLHDLFSAYNYSMFGTGRRGMGGNNSLSILFHLARRSGKNRGLYTYYDTIAKYVTFLRETGHMYEEELFDIRTWSNRADYYLTAKDNFQKKYKFVEIEKAVLTDEAINKILFEKNKLQDGVDLYIPQSVKYSRRQLRDNPHVKINKRRSPRLADTIMKPSSESILKALKVHEIINYASHESLRETDKIALNETVKEIKTLLSKMKSYEGRHQNIIRSIFDKIDIDKLLSEMIPATLLSKIDKSVHEFDKKFLGMLSLVDTYDVSSGLSSDDISNIESQELNMEFGINNFENSFYDSFLKDKYNINKDNPGFESKSKVAASLNHQILYSFLLIDLDMEEKLQILTDYVVDVIDILEAQIEKQKALTCGNSNMDINLDTFNDHQPTDSTFQDVNLEEYMKEIKSINSDMKTKDYLNNHKTVFEDSNDIEILHSEGYKDHVLMLSTINITRFINKDYDSDQIITRVLSKQYPIFKKVLERFYDITTRTEVKGRKSLVGYKQLIVDVMNINKKKELDEDTQIQNIVDEIKTYVSEYALAENNLFDLYGEKRDYNDIVLPSVTEFEGGFQFKFDGEHKFLLDTISYQHTFDRMLFTLQNLIRFKKMGDPDFFKKPDVYKNITIMGRNFVKYMNKMGISLIDKADYANRGDTADLDKLMYNYVTFPASKIGADPKVADLIYSGVPVSSSTLDSDHNLRSYINGCVNILMAKDLIYRMPKEVQMKRAVLSNIHGISRTVKDLSYTLITSDEPYEYKTEIRTGFELPSMKESGDFTSVSVSQFNNEAYDYLAEILRRGKKGTLANTKIVSLFDIHFSTCDKMKEADLLAIHNYIKSRDDRELGIEMLSAFTPFKSFLYNYLIVHDRRYTGARDFLYKDSYLMKRVEAKTYQSIYEKAKLVFKQFLDPDNLDVNNEIDYAINSFDFDFSKMRVSIDNLGMLYPYARIKNRMGSPNHYNESKGFSEIWFTCYFSVYFQLANKVIGSLRDDIISIVNTWNDHFKQAHRDRYVNYLWYGFRAELHTKQVLGEDYSFSICSKEDFADMARETLLYYCANTNRISLGDTHCIVSREDVKPNYDKFEVEPVDIDLNVKRMENVSHVSKIVKDTLKNDFLNDLQIKQTSEYENSDFEELREKVFGVKQSSTSQRSSELYLVFLLYPYYHNGKELQSMELTIDYDNFSIDIEFHEEADETKELEEEAKLKETPVPGEDEIVSMEQVDTLNDSELSNITNETGTDD